MFTCARQTAFRTNSCIEHGRDWTVFPDRLEIYDFTKGRSGRSKTIAISALTLFFFSLKEQYSYTAMWEKTV